MAKIVFIAHGLTSPLNTSLELSRRLEAAGHRVTYVSHADIGDSVAAAGFGFVRLNEDPAVEQPPALRLNVFGWISAMRRVRRRSIESRQIEEVITDLEPDLLLIDIEMHYSIIATASLGIPTMLVLNWFSILKSPVVPPLSSAVLPADADGIERAWRRVRRNAVGSRIRHKLSRRGLGDLLRPVSIGTNYYADLRQVARSRDYSLPDNTDRNQWLLPFTYTRLPMLCLNARELEFPNTDHPNLRYAGPMVNLLRREHRAGDDVARWEKFLSERRDSDERRPLVYCSLGSYWTDTRFIQMVLATFARRSDWDLVLGLGGQADIDTLGDLSPNVLALDWAPQLDILSEADCAINHGGIASINEAIASGVPMVVYSPSLLDQDGCAARVEYHGVGVRGDWKDRDPEQLERHIEQVLSSERIRSNVAEMKDAFARYERDGISVDIVETMLAASASG